MSKTCMLDNTKFESEKCRLNISAPLHTIIGLFLDYGTTEDRTHNAVNEVMAIDTNNDADMLYDSNGNLTKWTDDPEGTPVVKEFLWDDLNRLTKIVVDSNDEAIFIYDVNNQRVRKEYDSDDDGDIDANDETIEFVWADGHVIEEYLDGSLDRNYVHGNQFIDELVLFEDSSGDYHYYLQDFRYTVYALVDDTGTVEERYRFDPYGKRTVVTNDANIDEHYGFTGRYHDDSDETDLIYFRNRWMSGEMGRFINRDPLDFVDGMNLYSVFFVISGMDPLGLRLPSPEEMSHDYGGGGGGWGGGSSLYKAHVIWARQVQKRAKKLAKIDVAKGERIEWEEKIRESVMLGGDLTVKISGNRKIYNCKNTGKVSLTDLKFEKAYGIEHAYTAFMSVNLGAACNFKIPYINKYCSISLGLGDEFRVKEDSSDKGTISCETDEGKHGKQHYMTVYYHVENATYAKISFNIKKNEVVGAPTMLKNWRNISGLLYKTVKGLCCECIVSDSAEK